MSDNELGEFLKQLRNDLGYSLRDAGSKSGLSHSYIRDIERGINRTTGAHIKPTTDTLRKLSKAYNYSYNKLLEKAGHLSSNVDIEPTKFYISEESVDEYGAYIQPTSRIRRVDNSLSYVKAQLRDVLDELKEYKVNQDVIADFLIDNIKVSRQEVSESFMTLIKKPYDNSELIIKKGKHTILTFILGSLLSLKNQENLGPFTREERNLLAHGQLTLEELKEQYDLVVDGKEATDDEIEEMIKHLKMYRLYKENESP